MTFLTDGHFDWLCTQLLGRVRQLQKLPFHKLIGKDRTALVDLCFEHLDSDGKAHCNLVAVFLKDNGRNVSTGSLINKHLLFMTDRATHCEQKIGRTLKKGVKSFDI
jgi:hypothetical protein